MTSSKAPFSPDNSSAAGIYIHIPFCRQACIYCNFHFSTSLRGKEEMLQAIVKELELRKDYLEGRTIETVYFGGGTPSLLSADELNIIFDAVLKNHPVGTIKEFTLEANPDDLDKTYLRSLRSTPVNRFSIGVQSFRDEDLQYMKRAHNAQQADYAIKAAQDAGFGNMSIDLIYGTPGLSNADWKKNLSRVAQLNVPHFSAYALTVEDKTALHHAISRKKAAPVDAEQAADQFRILMDVAPQMGYEHYEISNLALPGSYAIHNTNYWMGRPYLGIGPSAHSFDGANRRWNAASNITYANSILRESKVPHENEHLTPVQHLNEYIMTSLRTIWGCDLDRIAAEWDDTCATLVEKASHLFQEKKWIEQEGRILKLTNEGRLFADGIAGDMFVEEQ